ncbi:MarR family winged helix-turn-helix transcriptional regulator [Streptomyces sp. GC420]|uniref:MarR family winged helix-turn-helix transcriptional regulator n=1 Tax=Streptomyces sp. GC420 TaxID=2697568 RepID=UPI001414CC72|nr:MarR family transcriptional regulator [Streptomyces sp. GC420]NBM16445.1 MarR family transcriptional regulator [Streptomyces sp. GC420]
MARPSQYEELARLLSGIGAVKRDLARVLPHDCPPGASVVLVLLNRHGAMRMSRLAELMAIDMSVTSRHVAHVADRGWVAREPDPCDGRSRILRLTETGSRQLTRITDLYSQALARTLRDWSDEEVGRLNEMLARLRDSFGDCRARHARPDEHAGTGPAGGNDDDHGGAGLPARTPPGTRTPA